MPDNKDELRYEPRQYGKSFKAWQQFIAYSRSGEEIVYRTKEGDICSPAQVKKLITAKLKSLKAKLPKKKGTTDYLNQPYSQSSKQARDIARGMHDGQNEAIDQVNKILDELIGE